MDKPTIEEMIKYFEGVKAQHQAMVIVNKNNEEQARQEHKA
jgi:hypothetical protein